LHVLIVIGINLELILYAKIIFPKTKFSLLIFQKKIVYCSNHIWVDFSNMVRIFQKLKKKKKLFMAFDRHYCKQHLPNKDSPSNYWLVAAANAAAINGQRANY
jgi:hypothetical protein